MAGCPDFAASIARRRETGQWPCMATLVGRFSEGVFVGVRFGGCATVTSAVSTEFRVLSERRIRAGSEGFAFVVFWGVDSADGNEASEEAV